MKGIVHLYDYIFYVIYVEFKKIYSENLDPVFYSIMALVVLFVLSSIPFIYLIFDIYFEKAISKELWVVMFCVLTGMNILYFNSAKVRSINKKFNERNRRKKYSSLLRVLFILFLSLFFLAIKKGQYT